MLGAAPTSRPETPMRSAAALLCLILGVACSKEYDQSTRPEQVAGTYTLTQYKGAALPAIVRTDSTGILRLMSGPLVIGADHTFSETLSFTLTSPVGAATSQIDLRQGTCSMVREFALMYFHGTRNCQTYTGTAAGGIQVIETVKNMLLI